MAEKKSFDLGSALADALGKVPDPDTSGPERLEYLDISNLDADASNFYSMEGVDELAANIELIGLQQPLRVRANPDMPGRYLITSGHRRRAALWSLYEEDPEKWGRVPCIVEQPAASPELQELRLIMANSDTRKMNGADLAKQIERVQMLLYKLKEQGLIEVNGRMRDAVAEACQVSKTKIATLKVIREKLIPELRQLWEEGTINETCAYRLAQAPQEQQIRLTEIFPEAELRNRPEWAYDNWIQALQGVSLFRCPDDGAECSNIPNREERAVRHSDPCKSKCCMDCWYLYRCEVCCEKAKAKKEQQAEEKKVQDAQLAEIRARAREEDEKRRREAVEAGRAAWARIEKAASHANVSPTDVTALIFECDPDEVEEEDVAELVRRYNGTPEKSDNRFDNDPFNYSMSPEFVCELADLLHCTTDYLLGRTPEPTPAPAASAAKPLQFRGGHPDHDAVCWCIFAYGEAGTSAQPARWMAGSWNFYNIDATIDAECLGWIELPDYEGVLRK